MPATSARIASSCSAWIVATMSPMRPVRSRSIAASERALPHDSETGVGRGLGVEHLVVEAEQLTPAREEVAPARDAHRCNRRGTVERLGDRCPPVDDEWRLVGIGHREPADVIARAVVEVDTTEAERRVTDLQRREPPPRRGGGDVTLQPGLVGPAAPHVGVALRHPRGRPAHVVESLVCGIEITLLGVDLGVSRHAAPPQRNSAV